MDTTPHSTQSQGLHPPNQPTTTTPTSTDVAHLQAEVDSLRRLIERAFPILEMNPLYCVPLKDPSTTQERHWLISCSGHHSGGMMHSWIPYAFEAAYRDANLLPTESELIRYAVSHRLADAGQARRELHESHQETSSGVLTRCLELHNPNISTIEGNIPNDQGMELEHSTTLYLPICSLLCVEQIIVSVRYLLTEHIYPSIDNISICLHVAFSLRNITTNDILTCAKFGVEDGRLIVSGDVILLPHHQLSSQSSTNGDATDTKTVFTCYPQKYMQSDDLHVLHTVDDQLLESVNSFYHIAKETTVAAEEEESSPFRLALLAKKSSHGASMSAAPMGLLIWLLQRCIARDAAPVDHTATTTPLLLYYMPRCPLWPECCGQQYGDGTSKQIRARIELRTLGELNQTSVVNARPSVGSSNASVEEGALSIPSPSAAATARSKVAEAPGSVPKHDADVPQHDDDSSLAREQLLFIHCFKNELLAGQGILVNQVNNLCKVRCGRTVRYREFGFGKLRDFLEDIKGLQVVGEKFQMTIRLTDVFEFDLFIREANARKSGGGGHHTSTASLGLDKTHERDGKEDSMVKGEFDKDDDDEEAELKHLTLPQLIPEDVIDKLRYMFSCEHYQIEASVFVSLFKNRYFASDPMVYERLGYKRMRDFLGAVPQVHKQGTKAESKYVWVENSAPLRLSQLGVPSIGGHSGGSKGNATAIDFLHSTSSQSSTSISNGDTLQGAGLSFSLDDITQKNTASVEDILNQASTGGVHIAVADLLTGICGGASNGLEKLIGFSPAGVNIYKLIHPDDRVSVRLRIDEAMAMGLNSVDLSTFRLRSSSSTTPSNNTITVSGNASWLIGNVWTISLVSVS